MLPTACDTISDIVQNAFEAGATEVRLEVAHRGHWLDVRVQDNGRGMDEATQRRALDPFWTELGKHPGRKVGLGLPFLKQAADQCGGSMSLQSAPGKGTVIAFRFDEAHVDAPPTGNVPELLTQLMAWPGGGELSVRREENGRSYEVTRSGLSEALGGLQDSGSLALMKDFFVSNEAELTKTDVESK